jgi:signal peptidase II
MLYFLFSVLIILCDQFFKYWVTTNIPVGGNAELLPGVVHLTYVKNTGAAFSILSGMQWLLLGIVIVCTILIIVIMIKYKFGPFGMLSLAAVLGGAVGNAIDRLALGHVVDMFELEFMEFAVFNIADIFITVGAILFLIYYIFIFSRKEARPVKTGRRHTAERHAADVPEKRRPTPSGGTEIYEMDIKTDWTEEEILAEYHMEEDKSKGKNED